MKGNRQIGLDGRVFINDCLSDGLFFVYSIMLSGILGAVGDVMKLTGKSGAVMSSLPNGLLTNGLIIMDLACCLGLVLVSYYIYFMNCGESMPSLGVKPLITLEYIRLAYYGMLIYDVLYRFCDEIMHTGKYPIAMSVFYVVYFGWLVSCAFAAMFILNVLNQNMIRRSYSVTFKMLALSGLAINIIMPLVFFITKIWIKGSGDGFYSAALCDFIRLGIAPIFYAAVWFLFLNAIDQIDRVFNEVDNAIRDKNYRIEFEEEQGKAKKKKKTDNGKSTRQSKNARKKKEARIKAATAAVDETGSDSSGSDVPGEDAAAVSPEIAFITAFDADGEQSDVHEDDNGEIGEMVDINALIERSPESSSEAPEQSGEKTEIPSEDNTSESTEEKQ